MALVERQGHEFDSVLPLRSRRSPQHKRLNASLGATPLRGDFASGAFPKPSCWLSRLGRLCTGVSAIIQPCRAYRLGHRLFLRNLRRAVHSSGETFEGQLRHGAAALR